MYLLYNIVAMVIFGTLGLFVREISLNSAMIALLRCFIGAFVLGCVLLIKRKRIFVERNQWKYLILSAVFLGCNWVFLFEGYRYTSISNATMIYYIAPIAIVVYSIVFYHLHISKRMMLCMVFAMFGLICMMFEASLLEWRGILFSLLAACGYTGLVIINRKIHMEALPFTFLQLSLACIILFIYVAQRQEVFSITSIQISELPYICIIGVVHTGVAYLLYFASIAKLSADHIALFSYLDPLTAIVLSKLLLQEHSTWLQWLGIVCIGLALLLSRKESEKHVL